MDTTAPPSSKSGLPPDSDSQIEQDSAQNTEQTTQPENSDEADTTSDQLAQEASTVQKVEKEVEEIEKIVNKRFRDHKLFFPIIIVVIIFCLWAIIALLSSSNNTGKSQKVALKATPVPVKKAIQPTPAANKNPSLIYGTWTSQSSVVRAVNLGDNDVQTVATLPLTIKKIAVLAPNSILYIDQTDNNDHGARISVYNITQQQITTNIPAANGFGIDDYVLSPNKRYLAIWEVQFSPTTNTLQGGLSRVYAVDLTSPTVPNLLYDENTISQDGKNTPIPIHYPRAILDNGRVLTDQFIPNDPNGGTGWAYGMSVTDFDGTNKQDISSMANGTYGSQPILSPDGKFMLFAGYDGSNGDGKAIKNGYRQALLTPNTVELLDINTFKRYKLPNLPPSNTYSDVQWDNQTGNVIISILSQNTKQMGVYSYDLGKLQYTQIPLPFANNAQYGYISQLTNNKALIGIQSTDPSNLGNLGETYSYAYTQLATVDSSSKLSYISVSDPFIQYITILPGDYFNNVLGTATNNQTTPQPNPTYALLQGTQNNQQNDNFSLKSTLASLRMHGLSNPFSASNSLVCLNLGNARCQALGLKQNSPAYTVCQNIEKADNHTANACF